MLPLVPVPADELIAIRALLEVERLPTSDLATAQPAFVAIREAGVPIAAGALQRVGSCALLRSVVVSRVRRGMGFGGAIVDELERLAREADVEQLILLTQTAAQFFGRRGYQVIDRSAAPAEVQDTEEFRSLCPSSAVCMRETLARRG